MAPRDSGPRSCVLPVDVPPGPRYFDFFVLAFLATRPVAALRFLAALDAGFAAAAFRSVDPAPLLLESARKGALFVFAA